MPRELPPNCPDDHRKAMESFATFWLADGSAHKIKAMYIPDFMTEITNAEAPDSRKRPLSKGAQIIRDAVKSRGAGRMCELLHMIISDLPETEA
jgi:hypothetical protein